MGKAFADLHIHLLCGVDDGAKTEETMQQMLDAAYSDGTRIICATPHYHPGYYGDNRQAVLNSYKKLKGYAKKYTDLQVFLGNELYYSPNCFEWLDSKGCKTLNQSRYLLLDFSEREEASVIVESTLSIFARGYTPVLAHAERYEKLSTNLKEIKQLKESGVLIQVDSQSPLGGLGRFPKKVGRKILEEQLADFVGSDAHNLDSRPPQLSECYEYVVSRCGQAYADTVFLKNAIKVLRNEDI